MRYNVIYNKTSSKPLSLSIMLNKRGEIIPQGNMNKVSPDFLPLLEKIISCTQTYFSENLHSIYLYGSIAEGRARTGISDGDFIIVLHESDTPTQNSVSHISQEVMDSCKNLISKIDISIVTKHEILQEENLYSWGAYVQIFGLPIYGEDLRKQLPMFPPSIELARGFNGDLRTYLQETLEMLTSATTDNDKQMRIRGASGKIIRSMFMMIAPQIGVWHTDLPSQLQEVISYFPEHKELYQYFFESRKMEGTEGYASQLQYFQKEILPYFEREIGLN